MHIDFRETVAAAATAMVALSSHCSPLMVAQLGKAQKFQQAQCNLSKPSAQGAPLQQSVTLRARAAENRSASSLRFTAKPFNAFQLAQPFLEDLVRMIVHVLYHHVSSCIFMYHRVSSTASQPSRLDVKLEPNTQLRGVLASDIVLLRCTLQRQRTVKRNSSCKRGG